MPKTTGVIAELRDQVTPNSPPGAFAYYTYQDQPEVGMLHTCPCGCGIVSGINLKPHGGRDSPMWEISGPRDAPTLTPSVGIFPHNNPERPLRNAVEKDGYHWHGFLKKGVWEVA